MDGQPLLLLFATVDMNILDIGFWVRKSKDVLSSHVPERFGGKLMYKKLSHRRTVPVRYVWLFNELRVLLAEQYCSADGSLHSLKAMMHFVHSLFYICRLHEIVSAAQLITLYHSHPISRSRNLLCAYTIYVGR